MDIPSHAALSGRSRLPAALGARASLAAVLAALCVAGCAKAQKPPPATPEAGYVVMAAQAVPLQIELPGRTSAFETSDVRPQVSGILMARHFTEGTLVRQGQTLYEIDPSLYRAALAQAQANLANAQALYADAQAKALRYKPLADIEAVSKQDYADAAALAKQAAAQIALQKAAVQTAQINLHFTRVPAPITGRVGRSVVTTGALVTNGQTTAFTTIERLDPIFVDIQQSSAAMLALRRELTSGGAAPSASDVQLVLEDGSVYGQHGTLQFSDPMVDPTTGAVTLRAVFPNPRGLLLPGMFVRARLSQATATNAILAPQQAVSRDPKGEATVYVIGPGNIARQRIVTTGPTVGAAWLVTAGLAPGDKVVTEGLDRIKPNQPVRPVPAGSPPTPPTPPSKGRAVR
jgi:membrane fusion protein (multidrug efflux system)